MQTQDQSQTTCTSLPYADVAKFAEELTALSRKYGVAIETGNNANMRLARYEGEFDDLTYSSNICTLRFTTIIPSRAH